MKRILAALVASGAFLAGPGLGHAAPAAAQEIAGTEIILTGVTAYDPLELLNFAAHLAAARNGTVTAGGMAAAVRQIYHEDGYFLAEVRVDADGRSLSVDEGEIGAITIEGADPRSYRLIESYFRPVVGRRAVNLRAFERAIMLVEDIEAVSATAEIEHPEGGGPAQVRVHVIPEDRAMGWVTLDNPPREFGEAATLAFTQEFLGAATPGDLLRISLSATAGFDEADKDLFGSIAYRLPIGGSGAFGEVYLGNVGADREAGGGLLETRIEGRTAILALGYPVLRDVERYGYALLEARHSETEDDVGGTQFESGVNVIGASWIHGTALPGGGALEYAVNLSFGHRFTDASGFDDGERDFWHLRAGFGVETPLPALGRETTLRAELWGQYSPDRLPAIEEFHLGGREDERGYAFAEVTGDTGLSATIELGHDFFPAESALRRIRPFGFVDAGFVRNNAPAPVEIEDETLASVGLGVDAEFGGGVHLRSYVALPLRDAPETEADDPALYLALTKSW